ncbi:hypothetical protein ACU610_22820 [Geodermatophilus sp. URMC 61]|uniref:hypothetical protein n=1 Tax=Geodermatophilus sp. URMC 61 TaxID=3423411 RepID=UPI00406D3DE6
MAAESRRVTRPRNPGAALVQARLQLPLPGEPVVQNAGDALTMPGATAHTRADLSTTATCEVLWVLTPAP